MKEIDYSSEAITRRLRQTEQLRVLSLSLMKAKRLQDERQRNANPERPSHNSDRDESTEEST